MEISKLLKKIQKNIRQKINKEITCYEWHSSIVLEGIVDSWDDVVKAGKLAANKGYKGVVNKIEVKNLSIPDIKKPLLKDNYLHGKKVDVLIIGGGIIGCAIARELSKWDISILIIEKEEDLAMHTSSRNDGMIHPGILPKPGTKKAIFNVRGNKLYSKVTKELDVPFRRIGSLMLFEGNYMKLLLPYIKLRAKQNRVEGIQYLSADEIRKRVPAITKDISGGIFVPTTGILSPYKMTIAYGENAVLNGAEISFNTIALSMKKEHGSIKAVQTNRGTIYPNLVINAAGVYSDKIAEMAGDQFFTIHPRKGQTIILDKKKGKLIDIVIAKSSLRKSTRSNTKGGGIVKTIDGNILVGPDAYEQPYREDYTTTRENIENIMKKHFPLIPQLSPKDVINYFAGIRAATYEEDFIVEKSEYVENLIHAAGIQSPGLASAPAIAEEIEKITINVLNDIQKVKPKENWNPIRKGIPQLNKMNKYERDRLIKERPDYGVIICRCEEISKGEIIDSIKSPIPAKSIDAIKRRVRPGMGRCQGGFCLPLVSKIIEEETELDMLSITKKGNKSQILSKETKEPDFDNEGGEASGDI